MVVMETKILVKNAECVAASFSTSLVLILIGKSIVFVNISEGSLGIARHEKDILL